MLYELIILLLGWLLIVGMILAYLYRQTLVALWREPVLRQSVLIIESDDWGPDPDGSQAAALEQIAAMLLRYHDKEGRHPVVTLGMVLAIPDVLRIRQGNLKYYHRLLLSDAATAPLLNIIAQGREQGIFTCQLHGMEHYWPKALMNALASDPAVQAWLDTDVPRSEDLPSPLQSRWTDASVLPSRPMPDDEMTAAVAEEVSSFTDVFGEPPQVVVPPTFVWSEAVERAWADNGLRVLVTPGRQFNGRDAQGGLIPVGEALYNGQRRLSGMHCVVRNDYFEPKLGHDHQRALCALEAKTRLGRPTLLEMHRFNFLADAQTVQKSLHELEQLLSEGLQRFPEMIFVSTGQLAEAMLNLDAKFIETDAGRRLYCWLLRLAEIGRLRKLLWLSGLILPVGLVILFLRPRQATAEAAR